MNLKQKLSKVVGFDLVVDFDFAFEFQPKPRLFLENLTAKKETTGEAVAMWNCKLGGNLDPSHYIRLIGKEEVRTLLWQFLDGISVEMPGIKGFYLDGESGVLGSYDEDAEAESEEPPPLSRVSNVAVHSFDET